jgi:hypothetical protein
VRTQLGLAVFVAVALLLAGAPSAAPGDVSAVRDAPILGIAVAGSMVAATLDQGAAECWHAELWNAANKATHLGKTVACDAPGGIRGPAIVGKRAVWATNIGGNLRDWTVWTATPTAPTPKALATVSSVGSSDPDPVVIGKAGAGIVAYAVGASVTALRENGSTAWTLTAPATVTLITSGDPYTQGTEVTSIFTAGGGAVVVDGSGKVLTNGSSDGLTVLCMPIGGGLMGQKATTLAVIGQPVRTFALPTNARLVGCVQDVAVYRVGATVSLLRISTGKTALLLTGTKVVAISPKGLAWATGSTLHWRPLASALKPLG